MRQSQDKVLLNSVPVYSFPFSATKLVSAVAPSAKSFIYRFLAPSQVEGYAESLANYFICRIYANTPGCAGPPSLFSRHSFTPIFEGPLVYPDLRGVTRHFHPPFV